MSIPEKIRPFWTEFEKAVGAQGPSRFYESFYFANTEPVANKLVLHGAKCGTASLLWTIEAERKPPPEPGDLSVVTNWLGEPQCVIRTSVVAVVPFGEVSEDFASTEGLGDGSLQRWKEFHWAFFGRECQRIGRAPSSDMPIVCERFAVVYRASR